MFIIPTNYDNFNNINQQKFSANLSEKEIILGITDIINQKKHLNDVKQHIDYFTDMKKGSNIPAQRKQEINEWLHTQLERFINYDDKAKKKLVLQQVRHQKILQKPSSIQNRLVEKLKNFLGIVDKKNPIIKRYYREKETAKFYIANKNIFTSYINLQPKEQYPTSSIINERNEKMKINTITTNINQNRINFSSETNNSTNSLAVNSSENDTFSSNKKFSRETKFGLGLGLVAIASTLIYYFTKRTPKGNIKTNTSMPIPSKPAHTPQGSLPHTPKDEHIVFNKNGNPQQILGCNEETAQHLKLEFLEAVKKSKSQKPWEDMSPQESTEWHNWYGEIYHKLHEQIKEYNISTVEKKVFSDDPLQQIEEKHKYIEDVIFRMQDNEASYYDGLLMFEKYGKREPFSTYGISTLSEIATSMPDNPTPKTVNKFMDIFEKFGIFTDSGSGSVDGQNYLNTLAKEGILTSEEQVVRAFEKGKNIIWCNDSIDDIAYTLVRAENAPFKNNSTVKNIIKQAYQTAFDNRTPLKDDFNIKSYERSWGITRE